MSQLGGERSEISTSTFLSWRDGEDGEGEEEEEMEPPEMKYCPPVPVKSEPEDREVDEDGGTFEDAVSSLKGIFGSGYGDEEAEAEAEKQDNLTSDEGKGRRRGSRRVSSEELNFGEMESESDWEEEFVKARAKKGKRRSRGGGGKGSRRSSPKKKGGAEIKVEVDESGEEGNVEVDGGRRGKKKTFYVPISELTPEQQEKRRALWRMQEMKKSERIDKPKKRKKRISELTPEQQERRRALWREQKMKKMERREIMLREVIKDDLEEDWEGEEVHEVGGTQKSGGDGRTSGGGGQRKKIKEMTKEEREKWRAKWKLDSARRIAKRKGLPVPEKLDDIQNQSQDKSVKSRDSSCSFESSDDGDDSSKSGGDVGCGDKRSGGRCRKKVSEMTEEEKEKTRAKWRLERARKIARAKGLPVPEKLEDVPPKSRGSSADNSTKTSRNRSRSSGGSAGGGGYRKKRVSEMTEEEKEAIRARWRLERSRRKARALGLAPPTKIEECTSKPRNPRNVRTLKDAINEEEREKVRAQYKRDMERRRQRYKTFTPEQRSELYQKMKFCRITKIARMTEDELKMHKMNQYFKYLAKKANLTEEQKERRRQTVQKRSKRKWQEIKNSPEALQKLKEKRKEYRQKMSGEQRERYLEKLRENARKTLMRKRQAMGDFREVVPRGPGGRGTRKGVEEWKFKKRLTEEEKEKKNQWRRLQDKKRRLEQRLTMQNLMDGGMTMEQILQQTETGQQRKRRLFKQRINKAKRSLKQTLENHNLPPEEINQRLVELEASYQPSREFRPYKPRKDGDSLRVDPKELEQLEEILKNHPGAKIQGRAPAGSKKSKKITKPDTSTCITTTSSTNTTTLPFSTITPSPPKRGRPAKSAIQVPKIENTHVESPPSTLTHQLFQQPPPHHLHQNYYATQPSSVSPQPSSSYPNPPQIQYPYTHQHLQQHHSFHQNQPQPSSSYSLQNILQTIGVSTSTGAPQPPPPQHQYCPSSTTSSQYGNYEEASSHGFDGDEDDNSFIYHDNDPNDSNYSTPPSPPPSPHHPSREDQKVDLDSTSMQNYHQNYYQPHPHPPPPYLPQPQPSSQTYQTGQIKYPVSRPPRFATAHLDPTKKPRVRKSYPTKLRPGAKPRTKRADVVRDAICNTCGQAFNSEYIREHERIYHNPNYDPIKMECLICHERFKVSKKWYQHYLHVHLGHVKMRRGMKLEEITIICEECGDPFKDKFGLKRHMHYVHGEGQKPENQFNCPVETCKFHTKDGATMQRHVRRVHAALGEIFFCTGKIECWRCPRNDFKNERELRIHVRAEHPESSFPCGWCGAVKFTQLALNLHYSTNKCAKRPKGEEKRGMKQVEGLPFLSIERAMVPCPICGREVRILTLSGHLKGIHNVEEKREWRCPVGEQRGGVWKGRCAKVYKRREFFAGHLEEAHEWKWEDMRGLMVEINGGNLEGMVVKKRYEHYTKRGKEKKKNKRGGSEGEGEEGLSDSEDEGKKKGRRKSVKMTRKRKMEEIRRGRRNIKVICEEDGGDDNKMEKLDS